VLEKEHSSTGFCAIIGGYVVRDTSLPELAGRYVYGDNCASGIRSVTLPGAGDDAATGLSLAHLTSFGEDSCGHVYATSGDGPVYRIDGDAFIPCPEGSPGPGPTPNPGGGNNPPPDGGGGNPTPTPLDKRKPVVSIGSHRSEDMLRLRGVRISVRCDEMCGATVTGRIHIARIKRSFALKRVARPLAAHKRLKVTLRASRRTLKAIRAGLRHHRRVTAKIVAVGRDAAGNAGVAKRTVRARG
jgi:hypothetical protein